MQTKEEPGNGAQGAGPVATAECLEKMLLSLPLAGVVHEITAEAGSVMSGLQDDLTDAEEAMRRPSRPPFADPSKPD